ncbi:MAG TPA: hypothetical protein VEC11_15655 [Allosphingosinicella sp.]|nr:hypothetical protein [Allosphingosinicella sp.]
MKLAPVLLTLLALAACGPAEPESTANKASRLEREIAEREKALNAQVENELSQTEQRLAAEADQALNSLNAAAANSLDEAVPAAPAQNRAR